MKKIINFLLCILMLFGCTNRKDVNSINSYEDEGITFSLPKNYYLDEDNRTIIHFENEELEIVGNVQFKIFDDNDDFNSFFKYFTVDFKGEYIKGLDAYKYIDVIRLNTYVKYGFYNKDRLNYFGMTFIDQNEKFIESIIKTVNNNAEIKANTKETIDYSFSNEWKDYEYDSFQMSLPNNMYISNPIDNQYNLIIKKNNHFKIAAILYLDEFTEKEFDYYKDVSPTGSRERLTDNIYKDIGIYSLINYDKKTISSIVFYIGIDNDFEKHFVDSLKFNK